MECIFPRHADKSSESNKNLTSGGRHLDAISKNKNLNMNEKCVMHYLAAHQDFTKDFQQWRFAAMQNMADDIGCSKDTVKRAIQSLETKGYLLKEQRAKGKLQLANNYKITEKIFQEFASLNSSQIVNVGAVCGEVGAVCGEVGAVCGEGGGCVPHEILPRIPSEDPKLNPYTKLEKLNAEIKNLEWETIGLINQGQLSSPKPIDIPKPEVKPLESPKSIPAPQGKIPTEPIKVQSESFRQLPTKVKANDENYQAGNLVTNNVRQKIVIVPGCGILRNPAREKRNAEKLANGNPNSFEIEKAKFVKQFLRSCS